MVKTKWTRKKRRTKPLKDISTPGKEIPDVEVEKPKSVENNVGGDVPEKNENQNQDDVNQNQNDVNPVEDEDNQNQNQDEDNDNPIENDVNPVEDEDNQNQNQDEDNQNEEASNNESEAEENEIQNVSEKESEDEDDENHDNPIEEEDNLEEEAANLDGNAVQGEQEQTREEVANLNENVEVEEERSEEEVATEVDQNNSSGEEGRERGSISGTLSEDSDYEALKPLGMYFPPSEYRKKIKISTRCFIAEVMETFDKLDPAMTEAEKNWFWNHPQFKHIFHMPQAGNHKLMGMWMLLLRTARITKEKEAWFAVNGCPIRYGIREHALISGLNCRNYPLNYKDAGGTNFVRRCFGRGIIRYQDVKAKVLEGMEHTRGRDRLRLLVLYFLSSVILGQTKSGNDAPPVDPFLLRAVDDLNLCRSFPWGRLSFDYMMKGISKTMAHFGGEVKEGVIWPIPGFCIPMELLAFEAITELGSKFRELVAVPVPTCPRMCKSKFKRSDMKGFPLSKINKELGNTKDIENILSISDEEQTLLDHITEPEDIRDKDDMIVESWMKRLGRGYVVRFEDMLEEDVTAREAPLPQNNGDETGATSNEAAHYTVKVNELVEVFNSFKADVGQWMNKIEDKVGEFDVRLAASEAYVQEQVEAMARNGGVGNSERPNKRSKKN